MSQPNLLITGATGFIGFHVLVRALNQGYIVRAAVRNSSQPPKLLSQLQANGLTDLESRLSFSHVPEVGSEDAYDQAVQGVENIIHLAAPLPLPGLDPQTGIFEPSVQSVRRMLSSATKASSVKKVVITASVVSVIDFTLHLTKEITADTRISIPPQPFDVQTAYRAGKIAGLNEARDFVKEQKPAFEVVNILPAFNYGHDLRASKAEDVWASTNGILLSVITGKISTNPLPAGASDVDDVANAHIQALKPGIVGDYAVLTDNAVDDAWDVVQREFPVAVETGIFSRGHQPNVAVNINASKTASVFDLKLKSYEDMVKAVAGQYLELSGEERA